MSSYCLDTEKIQYLVTTKPVLFFGLRPYELQALLATNYKHCVVGSSLAVGELVQALPATIYRLVYPRL